MIIYISSDKGRILAKSNHVIKRYDRWKCNIRKFIKEEYVNIANSDCEMIIVDVYAMERVEEILHLKDAFRKSIIVMLIPGDYRGTYPEGIDIIIKDERTDEKLLELLNPQNVKKSEITKVGIWSDDDKLSLQFAISLLSFFYKKIDDVCLVEISDEFILGKNLKQYKLKDKEGIKYKNIPIVNNAIAEHCKTGIFTFIKKDSKRLFNLCDIPIEVISKERIKVGNKSYSVSYSSRSCFKRNNAVFNKIFQAYVTKQKSSKIEKGIQIIKEQRRIFFPASIIILAFFFSIVLFAIISGKDKGHVKETVPEPVTKKEAVTEKAVVSEEMTTVEVATKETRTQKVTIEETTKGNKKTRKKDNVIPESEYTVPEESTISHTPEIKITEKVIESSSESKKQSNEKIEGGNREKIKDINPNQEKIE